MWFTAVANWKSSSCLGVGCYNILEIPGENDMTIWDWKIETYLK